MKLHMLLENIYKDWWGQQSAKEASNQQKLCTMLLAWLWRVWKSLFCFYSLNSECVTCVCLQCGRHKQNRYCFLGKTTTIDKCTVSLKVISIAYLFGKSLVSILSQHCRQMQTKVITANESACSLFSVWLLYKSIFLLAQLSSATTSKLLAWFSWNFKYPFLKHCR